jgi:hypothetical protein
MTEHNDIPYGPEPEPKLSWEETFPEDYTRKIGKNNLRINFNKITCNESSCIVAKDALLYHPNKLLFTKSASVSCFYIHQFWHTLQIDLGEASFTCMLHNRQVTVDIDLLRNVFGLPELGPDEEYDQVPTEEELIEWLRDIGYDESEEVVTRHSRVNIRFLPQPWRTLCILIAKSLSGRDTGHEHPKLQHLKLFWAVANVKKVDFASIIWEDLVWHIQHKTTNIPFVRFTKLLIESFLREYDDIRQRLDDKDKHTFRNEETLRIIKRLDTSTRKQGKKFPDYLLNDKVKLCPNYKYYVQALKEDKVGFLDEVQPFRGKTGTKTGSSGSSTQSKHKKKGTLKRRIPVKKPASIPEPGWFPSPQSSPKPSDSETESDEGPIYMEAYANIKENVNLEDIDDKDMTFEDWDKNINEYVEESERHVHRPLTEADAKLEEERIRKEKMKEPMTAEQESTHSHIGLSAEEENERALNLGILHSKIDAFQADQPPPPLFSQTDEAGGSSSIPEPTTGTNADLVVYNTPTVSPTDVEMLNASAAEEGEEEDHMDTEAPHLLNMEEMELRERALEEELKKKQEAEEARLEELAQAKLEETIRMEESRKAEEAAKLAEEKLKGEEEARLAEELRLKAEADKLAEEQRLKEEAAKATKVDQPEPQRGDDTITHMESSQSSPPASDPTHDESIKKPTSTKASAASKLIKKAFRRVHDKKKSKLEDQVASLASQVAKLTKLNTNVQELQEKVDTFLAKDVQEDLEATLAAQTHQYMEQHLVPELKELLAPMRDELTKFAEQAVKKVIRSTSFTLRADKSTLPKPEMTMDELESQLFDILACKTTLSPEETKVWEALRIKMSKDSCSTEADKLKRPRDDEDKDPNTQAKKQKQAEGPSSQPNAPVIPPTTTTSSQQPKESGSAPKAHDHFEYTGGDEIPQPDEVPEPSSKKKKERKRKHHQHKPDTSSKGTEPKKPKTVLKWLDQDETAEYSWFEKMINSQPPLADNQEPQDGRTVEYAQFIQHKFQMKKMNKKELRRIKNDAFNLLKDRSANSIELEYHLENIARAMSSNIDWINPESYVDPVTRKTAPYITDWSKPLPMIGKPKEPKIPYKFFFNNDLEFLQLGSKIEKKYVTSLAFLPAARYLNNAIEEEASALFIDKVVDYDRNALYGIHHWPDNRAQYYRSSRLNQTMGNVTSELKIVSIQFISTVTHFGYPFLSKITL